MCCPSLICNSNFIFFFFLGGVGGGVELVHLIVGDIYMSIDWLWRKRKG
jgi:hypothetical protein